MAETPNIRRVVLLRQKAFIASVLGAGEVRERSLRRNIVTGQREDAYEMMLIRRGLFLDEGPEFERVKRKGFSADEAARIVIEGRRAENTGGAA